MFITTELLKEKNACSNGIRWFEKIFPNSTELNDEAIAKIEKADTGFIWWFYNNVQQDARLYKLCGVNRSNGVNLSDGVNWSDGVNRSDGVNGSFGVLSSYGVDNALFLANKPREYSIFGKSVTQERFSEVNNQLYSLLNGWRPTFNNIKALYLANGSDWKLTPISNAEEISKEEAWRDMPKEAIKYVKSLPEFDAGMFEEITGIK